MPNEAKSILPTTRVSSRGQVVLPASIRASKDWGPGTELEVVDRGDEVVLRRHFRLRDRYPVVTWDDFVARRPAYNGPYVTDDMIRDGIQAEARRRWDDENRR